MQEYSYEQHTLARFLKTSTGQGKSAEQGYCLLLSQELKKAQELTFFSLSWSTEKLGGMMAEVIGQPVS